MRSLNSTVTSRHYTTTNVIKQKKQTEKHDAEETQKRRRGLNLFIGFERETNEEFSLGILK